MREGDGRRLTVCRLQPSRRNQSRNQTDRATRFPDPRSPLLRDAEVTASNCDVPYLAALVLIDHALPGPGHQPRRKRIESARSSYASSKMCEQKVKRLTVSSRGLADGPVIGIREQLG